MMEKRMVLVDEIKKLIELKHEGGYWDFKLKWYNEESDKANMLHDIICFANNLENRDCYIIIGVDNETFNIEDVSVDENRRNTQNLTDFLKDKKFIGEYRPIVRVESVIIENKTIDAIIIENTNHTPYVLREKYRDVNANNIYTRIQDTNTPKNSSADFDKMEYLWQKRFGLNLSIVEKFKIALDDYEDWYSDLGNKNYMYSKKYPEYHIELEEPKELDCEPIKCFYTNPAAYYYPAKCYYNNTLIYELTIWAVDEFRKFIVRPEILNIGNMTDIRRGRFYNLSTIEGKILKILCPQLDLSSREFRQPPLLIFNNKYEEENFIKYAQNFNISQISIEDYKYDIEKDEEYIKNRLGICAEEMTETYFIYQKWLKEQGV